MAASTVVYDPANEVLVLRAAIALLQDYSEATRKAARTLLHSLSPDEFLISSHSSFWSVLRHVVDRNLEYSSETVRQLNSTLSEAIGVDLLDELEATAEVHPNLDFHVERLRWDATRARTLQGSLAQLVGDLKDPNVAAEQALSSARSVVRSLEGAGGRRYIHRPKTLAESYHSDLVKRREEGNFYPSGFKAMDDSNLLSEGFMPGNTSLITGLSSSGKSTFAAALAVNQAKLGRRPMICAWEMGARSTLDVIGAMLTGIPLDTIIRGTYNDAEFRKLDKAARWAASHIRFMENAFFSQIREDKRGNRRSNERNLDIFEGYIAESGCDVIIADLWDRLLADQSPEGVTDALYRQQNMCKEYGVHGCLVVQLRLKDVEKRADKRPTRESIKGVATFVEVADLILGVHRDAQFKSVPDDGLEVICLKQRKGKLNWAVRFDWSGAHCRISGGAEVPYNPGLESGSEFAELGDPSAIRTKRPRSRINNRD